MSFPNAGKRVFKRGEILIRSGDAGDYAYIIEKGSVEILVTKNNSLMQIGTRGAGALLGEMAMIDDKPRTATVRALEDGVLICVSREDFSRRLDAADPVLRMVMHVVMTRYRDLISRTRAIRFPHEVRSAAEDVEITGDLHDDAVKVIKIQNELKTALEEEQLVLHYQPIIDLKTMKVAGVEALMRWAHPEKGLIPPAVFIPVAEDSGLIVDMTKWALNRSCLDVTALARAAAGNPEGAVGEDMFVSVNFSVHDFEAEDMAAQVQAAVAAHGIKPQNLRIEITETLLMQAPEHAKAALESCRAAGVGVSIDDFGTGYSSLNYLHSFPIDTLKIDQTFIRAMTEQDTSMVLVKSILGLAKNLGMQTLAEGIETEEEARIMRDLDCDKCQGYGFSKPLPLVDALSYLGRCRPADIFSR